MTAAQPSPDAIAALARRAGLDLSATQLDELIDASAHVEAMLVRLSEAASGRDEPAHVFLPRAAAGVIDADR